MSVKNKKESDKICNLCQHSYYCTRLKTACVILEEKFKKENCSEKERIYEEIKNYLKGSDWNFPDNDLECTFSNVEKSVCDSTYELIKLLKNAS